MAAADEQQILAGGTLYADGTAMGTVLAISLEHVGFVDSIDAEEWGGEYWDGIFLREEVICTAVLANWDADGVAAYFPNVSGGQVSIPGSHDYGSLQSDKAVELLHTPLPGSTGGFTVYEAHPILSRTVIPFNAQTPMLVEVSWLGVRDSSGNMARVAAVDPLAILGATKMVGWWDASDSATITSDANGVSAWNDKSGNANHLLQAVSANKPNIASAAVNSLDAMLFVATNVEYMQIATSPIQDYPFRVFAVSVPSATASHVWSVTKSDNSKGWFETFTSLGRIETYVYDGVTGIDVMTGQNAWSASTPILLQAIEASTVDHTLEVDGASAATSTTSSAPDGAMLFTAGAKATGANNFDGHICEIVVVDETTGAITAAEATALESYLATRWGITLP